MQGIHDLLYYRKRKKQDGKFFWYFLFVVLLFIRIYAIINKIDCEKMQREKPMQKIFARYISYIISIALLVILALNWGLQGRNARIQMVQNAKLKLGQISRTLDGNEVELENLKESLDEDYLTRAYAFAYILEQNPDIVNSQDEMERVAKLLNVDELHVIDENGILFAGNVPLYFGMDFHSTEQTSEFLSILDDPDSYLVQDIRPNGYEQKVFQYIGVARQDKKGIVQVGMAPTRMLEAQKRNQLDYIFSRVPVDKGWVMFAADKTDGTIKAHTESKYEKKNITDLGLSMDSISEFGNGEFSTTDCHKYYYVIQQEGDMILGAGAEKQVLYQERNVQILLTFACLVLISLITIVVINRLLRRQIVDGVHTLMDDISRIADGNLETVVNVNNNPEFCQLSAGINKMVQGILDSAGKISRVIEIVDMPIGVFEFSQEGSRVMATSRLRQVMNWSGEQMEEACKDKEKFVSLLKEAQKNASETEKDVFKVSDNPERWVKIYSTMENGSTFGVVSDVTKDMMVKRQIEHERDYDSLTGLCNIDIFKKKVNEILKEKEIGCAAIIMLDIDYFKGINDGYGHDWGDVYLRTCADFLREFEDGNGIAARRSGDEFCLFLYRYSSRAELVNRMEEFYGKLSENKIKFPDGSEQCMAISSGIAWCGGSLQELGDLLKAADYALYDAKNNGRGIMKQYMLN